MNKKCVAVTLIVLAIALAFPPVGKSIVFQGFSIDNIQVFDFTGFRFFLSAINDDWNNNADSFLIRYDLLLLEVLVISFIGTALSLLLAKPLRQ